MDNEEIKNALLKIYKAKFDFSVCMTGKQSLKVNGLYKPETHEILLHNKNFKSDNALMYTAIHEFTHHILTTEKNVKTSKAHSNIFWSTFYDFIDIAISNGVYSRKRCEETISLIDQAKQIRSEILQAQKELGNLLVKINESCNRNGERYEDVVESDLQITRIKAKDFVGMAKSETSFSDEMTKAIHSAKDVMLAMTAAENGKTVEQVKAVAKKAKAPDDGLESPEKLKKEKVRLERTIEQLNDRLVQVEETLNSMTGSVI